MATGQAAARRAPTFVPRDDVADRQAQDHLKEAHQHLQAAERLARVAGWGNQIRDDMANCTALVAYVRRAFL